MEPKVRFKGFEGEWRRIKFGTISSRITRRNNTLECKLPLTISANEGLISQEKFFKNIVASSNLGNYYLLKRGEFAYNKSYSNGYPFGAIKRLDKYDSGVLSPLYICFGIHDEVDSDYICFFFETTLWHKDVAERATEGARNHGILNIGTEDFFDIDIMIPESKEEQQAIATYFLTLDSKIQSTSKKLASLKKLKSASLVAMFPQNGESMPKVRFKGFEGEWSTNNLGSIFAERIESNENGEMLSVTMNNGIIRSSDNGRFDNSNSDKSKYKVVKIGDIAYNSMRMWQGASGVSQYEGIVSPAYTVVTPSVDVDTDFFGYLFKTDDVIRLFKLNSQGLTSDNWNLNYPAFSRICVSYPESKEEQQAIAAYFRSLDRKIALETARLEKLKQIKLACLDKMFV